MPEAEITRKQIIVVDAVGTNSYGDLTWTDKEGKSYKVKSTRKQYFEAIVSGQAAEISFSKYRNTEYPYSAIQVKDILSAPKSSTTLKVEPQPKPELPKEYKSSPETGMWWGQMGEMLRCGDIDKTTPQGKALRNAYYTEMFRVLGINIKEVQPTKRLVEEAMKLGKEVKS